jgi:hypothetical protein
VHVIVSPRLYVGKGPANEESTPATTVAAAVAVMTSGGIAVLPAGDVAMAEAVLRALGSGDAWIAITMAYLSSEPVT